MVIDQVLREIWFSEKENKLYIKCLEFGKITAWELAKQTHENRATVYSVLKEMIHKGYITEIDENKIKRFSAVDPKNIIIQIKNQATMMEENLSEFDKIAHVSDMETKTRVYHGLDQAITIFDDIIKSKYEVLEIMWNLDLSVKAGEYLNSIYMPKKVRYQIKTRSIVSEECKELINERNDKRLMRRRKFIPNVNFWNNNIIYVYGKNRVATIHTDKKKMFGIVIENEDIHNMYKAIFNNLWDQS